MATLRELELTYPDVVATLERYSLESTAAIKSRFPTLNFDMVLAAAEASDECPVCTQRGIAWNGTRRHLVQCLVENDAPAIVMPVEKST